MKVVNFLDITLDLNTGEFKPFMKENDNPVYVDVNSNHPPMVLKNIPMGVNRRLSRISSTKEIFEKAKSPYQEALNKSGYNHALEFAPVQENTTKKKTRKKPVTWFNPPYSMSVKSRVGREFLTLLDSSFPPSNPLHKLFNRHTVKLSYRCMPNMAQAVSGHNKEILQEGTQSDGGRMCNCKGGTQSCPVGGKCLTRCVVYEATVTQTLTGHKETYTGVTGRAFKDRLYEHRTDMNCAEGRDKTSLSAHIWDLKDSSTDYNVTWRIKDRATDFNPSSRSCRICLKEKFHILYRSEGASLNKRSEIFNTCLHRKQKLLENVKT